jgi:hypothetical protein
MHKVSTFTPSHIQLKLLAVIVANEAKPNLIIQTLSTNPDLAAAKQSLATVGAIIATPQNIALTQSGKQLCVDNDIIDDAGAITDTGNGLLDDGKSTAAGSVDIDPNAPPSDGMGTDDFSLESVSPLFLSLLTRGQPLLME